MSTVSRMPALAPRNATNQTMPQREIRPCHNRILGRSFHMRMELAGPLQWLASNGCSSGQPCRHHNPGAPFARGVADPDPSADNKQEATSVQMLLQTFTDHFSSTSCEQSYEYDPFIDIVSTIVMKEGLDNN
ncbi:hypothetical protein HGM15179_004753, partial [Zosterops borbonicus]